MRSPALLAIGDFSRATQLSIKMLRHYHQIGLLEPVDVDRATGYRRYSTDQISTAQIIRRFRALEMPLDEIRTVMSTTDSATRPHSGVHAQPGSSKDTKVSESGAKGIRTPDLDQGKHRFTCGVAPSRSGLFPLVTCTYVFGS
jgi:DNA-binding transcriptional MerR regulator